MARLRAFLFYLTLVLVVASLLLTLFALGYAILDEPDFAILRVFLGRLELWLGQRASYTILILLYIPAVPLLLRAVAKGGLEWLLLAFGLVVVLVDSSLIALAAVPIAA